MINWKSPWRPALLVAVIAVGALAVWFRLHRAGAEHDVASDTSLASGSDAVEPVREQVTLSAAKTTAAKIRIEPVKKRSLPDLRVLSGRLQYDDRWHAAVRAASTGTMVEVRVRPGDRVVAGQALAILSSPDIGAARADVLKREAEWEIAQRKWEWEAQIEKNLQPFVAAIRQRLDPKLLQEQFRAPPLGEHRERLVSAYSRWVLAESLLKTADAVSTAGLFASRTVQERMAEQQVAEAAVRAACEQALFEAEQRRALASLSAADARRRWDISRLQLQTLLGYDPALEHRTADQDLSRCEVRAPFAGSIEQRRFSVSERVQPGDELFILADTSTLWVKADVREQDWPAIQLQPGQAISVHVPAIPDQKFVATVYFTGREVSRDSNAISLVAVIDNPEGQLRPGLFVQVTLSIGEAIPVLAVPSTAVVTHNEQTFVFVQEVDYRYRRVGVETGHHSDDWIEIRSGLNPGDRIVVHGAFILKSELLLESE